MADLPRHHCELLSKSRKTAGILMAVPFVICFGLFGTFNLIGGTVLTSLACKPKFSKGMALIIQQVLEEQSKRSGNFLDPMIVVGVILLVTGTLLVSLGILLSVVACRSINFDRKRMNSSKHKSSWASFSGVQQLSSTNGPVTTYAVMTTLGSLRSGQKNKSKLALGNPSHGDKTSTTSLVRTVVDIDIHKVEEDISVSTNCEPLENLDKQADPKCHKIVSKTKDCETVRNLSKKNCSVSWASPVSPSKTKTHENVDNVKEKDIKPP